MKYDNIRKNCPSCDEYPLCNTNDTCYERWIYVERTEDNYTSNGSFVGMDEYDNWNTGTRVALVASPDVPEGIIDGLAEIARDYVSNRLDIYKGANLPIPTDNFSDISDEQDVASLENVLSELEVLEMGLIKAYLHILESLEIDETPLEPHMKISHTVFQTEIGLKLIKKEIRSRIDLLNNHKEVLANWYKNLTADTKEISYDEYVSTYDE